MYPIDFSVELLSIQILLFYRLMSGDMTQFIQRPLFLEFWLVCVHQSIWQSIVIAVFSVGHLIVWLVSQFFRPSAGLLIGAVIGYPSYNWVCLIDAYVMGEPACIWYNLSSDQSNKFVTGVKIKTALVSVSICPSINQFVCLSTSSWSIIGQLVSWSVNQSFRTSSPLTVHQSVR